MQLHQRVHECTEFLRVQVQIVRHQETISALGARLIADLRDHDLGILTRKVHITHDNASDLVVADASMLPRGKAILASELVERPLVRIIDDEDVILCVIRNDQKLCTLFRDETVPLQMSGDFPEQILEDHVVALFRIESITEMIETAVV